jgi:hypothetical protein
MGLGLITVLLTFSNATSATSSELSLECAVMATSSWKDVNAAHPLNAPLIPQGQEGMILRGALWHQPIHSLKIDFGKKSVLVDRPPGEPPGSAHNNPALGEIKVFEYPEVISISNVLPDNHPDAVTRLSISIHRHTKTFVWLSEVLGESNTLAVSSAELGLCDTANKKF